MNTPIKESNLAHIGSPEDKAAKKAAAETEIHWKGAGTKEGIEIWRVENKRDEFNNPQFGINKWPKKRYGEFYTGDSYIILSTIKDGESESQSFLYDLFFWIGDESSQDEYGVAAYKANELDDMLGDAPIQHREVQNYESDEFLELFKNGIKYLDGGIDGGFREIKEGDDAIERPKMLFHIRRFDRQTRNFQVPVKCSSLNEGDAFVLDAGNIVYTWFGVDCSPFEKQKAAEVAHNIAISRRGQGGASQQSDVQDDNLEFWSLLGGKQKIKPADAFTDADVPKEEKTSMYLISEVDSKLEIKEVPVKKSSLVTGGVCLVDTGKVMYVWIGKKSAKREQQQAMLLAQRYIKGGKREKKTCIVRVREGQERRVRMFKKAF
jgi:hypothetical protein